MALKTDNPSFVLRGIHDTIFEDRPIPELGPNDCLIEIKKTGICGSDVHYLNHARIGDFVLGDPMILGHESAGVIVKTGGAVKSVKVGDRVALEPGDTCTRCHYCKHGTYELCEDIVFAATPPNTSGTLTRYYKLPSELCYLLPESMSLEDGAMIEPLAVGAHSVHTLGKFVSGQSCVVFGAGPVGLLVMAFAKGLGAKRIVAVDINADRLAFAKSYAATDIFQPPPPKPDETRIQHAARIVATMQSTLGITERGPASIDLVIEATGAEVCIQAGLMVVAPAGRYVQVGMGAENVQIPIHRIATREINVVGSFRYGPGDYNLAISLVSRGLIDLKPLVTHRFKFQDALEAFGITQKGVDPQGNGVIKCIISGPE